MLYLSRMDPSRDPKKACVDTAEEQKRRSLAHLGVKEGEDSVAEYEVGLVEGGWFCGRHSLLPTAQLPRVVGYCIEHFATQIRAVTKYKNKTLF